MSSIQHDFGPLSSTPASTSASSHNTNLHRFYVRTEGVSLVDPKAGQSHLSTGGAVEYSSARDDGRAAHSTVGGPTVSAYSAPSVSAISASGPLLPALQVPSSPPSINNDAGGGTVASSSKLEHNTLPRINFTPVDASSAASDHSSSPYVSPRLPPRARQGGIGGSMGDITLPPLSSAVPMRRGAVSGESSGPSLPFPPMRLPYNEDDIPSRGPSPTLGKRPSFSMGHSRHVPPGPDAQLPTPALAGVVDRRSGPLQPGQSTGSNHPEMSRTGAIRLSDDGMGYYYTSSASATPRTSGWRGEGGALDEGNYMSMHPAYQQSGPPPHYARQSEEAYYSHGAHPGGHNAPPAHASQQPRFPMMYSKYSHGDVGAQMGTMLIGHPHEDHSMGMNGKRPRSAPRVLSSQPRIFACTQCPARFARNHDLKRHQRGHLSVRPYPCSWCGKSFSRKDALKRHVLVKVSTGVCCSQEARCRREMY